MRSADTISNCFPMVSAERKFSDSDISFPVPQPLSAKYPENVFKNRGSILISFHHLGTHDVKHHFQLNLCHPMLQDKLQFGFDNIFLRLFPHSAVTLVGIARF